MDICRQLDPRIIPFAPRRAEHERALEPRVRDWLVTQSLVLDDWLERLVAENADTRLIALLSQHAAFLRETLEEG
ncbi:MAG: hypothetical protein JJU26_06985 [Oceanicaulis sp.]|uniref:hypothetical protein n=1 Tax=Glycocaulis sp. TaxID=1969725 RepID=UPI0025BEB1DE|nr:hypothetical protein [Glycocaulis sp.]MCC5981449.1 hypothetical protein [Oceanicaulis sp.]MCH8521925.1 hypothetical protein [Glycocaulis sp.]